jgi:putative membrane protein
VRAVAAALALLALASPALAHGSGDDAPLSWTFDPLVVAPLLMAGALYAIGIARLWRSAGVGRGVRGWQVGCYAAGLVSLALALCSPLHWAGERVFVFHMIEHEIVMAISAPLIAVSRPVGAFLWAVPRRLRTSLGALARSRPIQAVWTALVTPRNATILHGIAIWAWHAPPLLDASIASLATHRLQHLSFLVTALLFWWALVRRASAGAAAGHLFVTMLHTSALGALIALAPRVLYDVQTARAAEWGLTPLEDQQLAGLVMWVPAGAAYAGAALIFAGIWIARSARGRHAVFRS